MSKRGFVRGGRKPPPNVPPVRIAVAAPLALPEREPRNILVMIALPALLVGIIGTCTPRVSDRCNPASFR
jgi:hypothetical protein